MNSDPVFHFISTGGGLIVLAICAVFIGYSVWRYS